MNSIENDLSENNFTYWDVDEEGNISSKQGKIAFRQLPHDQLLSQNWLTHMSKKRFINNDEPFAEFYTAYLLALKRSGVKSITIDIENSTVLIK